LLQSLLKDAPLFVFLVIILRWFVLQLERRLESQEKMLAVCTSDILALLRSLRDKLDE
jgi:hypothetical protein